MKVRLRRGEAADGKQVLHHGVEALGIEQVGGREGVSGTHTEVAQQTAPCGRCMGSLSSMVISSAGPLFRSRLSTWITRADNASGLIIFLVC